MELSRLERGWLLLGDIGGTNVRLYLVASDALFARETATASGSYRTVHQCRLKTADLQRDGGVKRGLLPAISSFVSKHSLFKVVCCVLSICGPVVEGVAKTTAPSMGDGWVLNEAEMALDMDLAPGRLRLINDFVAVGLSLTNLPADQYRVIYEGNGRLKHGPMGVLGPGTGLGACQLIFSPERQCYQVFPSEMGMAGFCPRTEDQWELRQFIARRMRRQSHVDVEQVVSGQGLAYIYAFLRDRMTREVVDGDESNIPPDCLSGPEPAKWIIENESEPLCSATIDLFLRCLGAECGDMAMRWRPTGGLFIAGGVGYKMEKFILNGTTRQAYIDKDQAIVCCGDIPLYLVLTPGDDLSLNGCLACVDLSWRLPLAPGTLSVHDSTQRVVDDCCQRICSQLRKKPDLVLCLASGATPVALYSELSMKATQDLGLFSRLRIVKLDEWYCGLPMSHPSTCESFLDKHVLQPWHVSADRYCSFRSDCEDPAFECARVERQVQEWGGLDIAVLGLGVNGHLGFNEPHPESLTGPAHCAVLSAASQQHSMVAELGGQCSRGLTLGMNALTQARDVLLMVTGVHKARALREALVLPVSSLRPASVLLRGEASSSPSSTPTTRGRITCICDRSALTHESN